MAGHINKNFMCGCPPLSGHPVTPLMEISRHLLYIYMIMLLIMLFDHVIVCVIYQVLYVQVLYVQIEHSD